MRAPFYKVMTADEWAAFERDGRYAGSALDRADGYVHLSTAGQVAGTVLKHFAGRTGLVAVLIDPARLPARALKWEESAEGAVFPHYYGELTRDMALGAEPIPDDPDQRARALASTGI